MRLDDDDDVLRSPTRTLSSSSSSSLAYSVSDSGGFCSVALSEEEDDHLSSSISSGCSSSETNEIATRLPFSDLEAHEISETEISTLLTNNFRLITKKDVSKIFQFLHCFVYKFIIFGISQETGNFIKRESGRNSRNGLGDDGDERSEKDGEEEEDGKITDAGRA
jgi:hypothetical protein